MTMLATTPVHHIWNACNALYLEVHEDIANDIKRKLALALDYMENNKKEYAKSECLSLIKHLSAKEYDFSAFAPSLDDAGAEEFYNDYLMNKK